MPFVDKKIHIEHYVLEDVFVYCEPHGSEL